MDKGKRGIRITAPSRLSFTLIDMNGELGRRNGIAALSISNPALQARMMPADELTLDFENNSLTHKLAIGEFMKELQERLGGGTVNITIERGIPANTGFGSKTTTLMALGKAYAALMGKSIPTEELAKIARRGGTSGASVNLIDYGGFIVDGGHANPPDFASNPQQYLLPSRFAKVNKIPPVLIKMRFPPWPILIIIGKGDNIQGNIELDWFRKTVPIPLDEARKTAHIVLMNLAPAIAEEDYEAFCRAVNTITFDSYFKSHQIANQSDAVKSLIREAQRRDDIDAFGMSSMGPMCYAFTRQSESVVAWLEKMKLEGYVEAFWFSNAQNNPAVLESI